MNSYLVFDIGGTFIKYALMDASGHVQEQGKVPSPTASVEELLDALEQVGKQYSHAVRGAAVSMPGRIDTKRGIAHTGGAFACIHDTPFAGLLRQRLGGIPVTIANDGKCAANAELADGALAGVDCGAVLVLGTGTGGGIVLDRKVWMGSTFAAGEFSLLPTSFQSLHKGIRGLSDPNIGCLWSSTMSASGLLGCYAARKGLTHGHGVDGFQFFAAYDAGEPEARAALEDLGRSAAAGIFAIQSVLDLSRYAIGGGISARPEVTDTIRTCLDTLFDRISFTPFSKPEVVRCRYGNDANLLGALSFHLARAED